MSNVNDFLFIADGKLSFITLSLKESLTNHGLLTDVCDVDTKHLTVIDQMPKFFIVDAEILLAHTESRVYLYDKCIEFNRKIVLIGYSDAVSSLYDVSSTGVIAKSFERPVNNNDVVSKLMELVAEYDEKGNKKNILVVDDSPSFLRLMSEWLEKDYNVNVCPAASAAFHMIETNKPDLILLDYEMPICNGAQFLQMLHSEPSTAKIPVMFLTSKDDAETVRALVSLKPQGYLLKNQSKANILHAIAEFFIKEQIK